MLGARRASVSAAAGILQKAGTRGCVTILDKARLEEAACDCYQIVEQQKEKWNEETETRSPGRRKIGPPSIP